MMIDKQTKKSCLTESKNFAANLFLKKIHNSMIFYCLKKQLVVFKKLKSFKRFKKINHKNALHLM